MGQAFALKDDPLARLSGAAFQLGASALPFELRKPCGHRQGIEPCVSRLMEPQPRIKLGYLAYETSASSQCFKGNCFWCRFDDSNAGPSLYKSAALPLELKRHQKQSGREAHSEAAFSRRQHDGRPLRGQNYVPGCLWQRGEVRFFSLPSGRGRTSDRFSLCTLRARSRAQDYLPKMDGYSLRYGRRLFA